jgi:hypothetical protein
MASIRDEAQLKEHCKRLVCMGLQVYYARNNVPKDEEAKVVVLGWYDTNTANAHLAIHISPLNPTTLSKCTVRTV